MSKLFFHPNNSMKLPAGNLIAGILIGVLYASILYGFLYMFREFLRIMSVTPDYDLWIMSDKEVDFYNLILALISVIFGQSVTFSFWYDRPRRFFSFNKIRYHSIVNDQRGFNWYFMFWFTKIGIFYGLFFGLVIHSSDSVSLYPDYRYLFILLVLVLFFNSWKTLRLKYKSDSLKKMMLSFFIVLGISFLLSNINLIDYNSINNKLLKRNIRYTYKLELAESDSSALSEGTFVDVYMVIPDKVGSDTKPLIVVKSGAFTMEQMKDSLNKLIDATHYKPFVQYRLFIDKNVKIKYVISLENEFSHSDTHRLLYAVLTEHDNYPEKYQNRVLTRTLNLNDIHKLKVLNPEGITFGQFLRISGL